MDGGKIKGSVKIDRMNPRTDAAALYDILEGMLYIALKGMHDSPRRESNRIEFVNVVSVILQEIADGKR